jgi:predicted aspartyl protease
VRLKAGQPIHALLTLCLIFPWALKAERPARVSVPKQFARLGYEPIELQRTGENHLFLFGKLNGRRRSVLVDSGWSFTTISTNTARRLPSPRGVGANEPPAVLIEELKLGRHSFSNQPARVEHMVFNRQAASFEVVLGCDFLRRHFAVIDCLNRRLYVRSGAPTEQEQLQLEGMLHENAFKAVTLDLKNPLAITCPTRVNDRPVEMLVDTGAVWSTLDVRQLDRLGLRAWPTLAKISGVGRTGTRGVGVAEATMFALGNVPMKDANFALMDLSDWGLAAPGKELSEVQGILGGTELVANGALIDCHRLKLWVKRSGGKK